MKAIVLLGGKSSRMGTDKYLINVNGRPQYQHVHDLLKGQGLEVFFSINASQSKSIPAEYNTIVDRFSEIGPISGLVSALHHDPKCSWLVVACDLIHLDEKGIRDLIDQNEDTFDVVTYQQEGSPFLETTLTIYNEGSYILLRRALRNRTYSLQDILKKSSIKTVTPHRREILDNANVPEDLNS